jgi:hypothetical protein
MTYEIAKQLKDAGFMPKLGWRSRVGSTQLFAVDLLSELMKALPDSCGLQLDDWGWTMYVKGFKRDFTISKEPEEAAAKLYIAIYEK